jgi:hypothetical protein
MISDENLERFIKAYQRRRVQIMEEKRKAFRKKRDDYYGVIREEQQRVANARKWGKKV